MGTNYFTAENAWRHLFFVTGQTADEFYTDGGLKVNIEQLTFLELRKSGYERIVFYDKDNKLYCYDDDSYALMSVNGITQRHRQTADADVQQAAPRQNRGLKRGRHAHTAAPVGNANPDGKAASGERAGRGADALNSETASGSRAGSCAGENNAGNPDAKWITGENSGVRIRNYGQSTLHLGMRDNTFVKRQIDAYMYDSLIKTAVVINDPSSFLSEFGNDPMHSFTAGYERMGTDNQNIMVFLYTDGDLGNIYQVQQFRQEGKTANVINITCPNAAELRNMLMYLRLNHGLKIRISELQEIALALKQAMSAGEKELRIKELYTRLENFGTEKPFTVNDCYEMLGVKKPDAARKQLEQLIGMNQVKQTLAEYYSDGKEKQDVFEYLTASRLQPDLERPAQSKELMHFALTGNPGTGKTTVANLIGQIFFEMGLLSHGRTKKVTRADLVAGYIGQTAIKTQKCIDEAIGGVLFIDEAYTLKRAETSGADFGQEAIDTILEQMSARSGDLVVIAAGYPREMKTFLESNPGLESRFRKIHIEDYTAEEMHEILNYHAERRNAVFSEELSEKLPVFCENWVNLAGENWGNAREAEQLISAMLRAWKNDPEKKSETDSNGKEISVLDIRHIPENLRDNLRPVEEMRAETLNRLNQMTGLAGVKATVEKLRRRMLSGDMKEPGHYLFTGNPGTGKTTVARYMGQILRNLGMLKKGHLVEYTASGLMSAVFDDKNHGNFYEVAKKAFDGVLFIDEAYQLASDTTGRGRPILDALLPFMENNRDNICIIAAGYEDEMDEFIKTNPGFKSRFADTIHFENYTGAELCEILTSLLAEQGITPDDEYRELSLRALTRYVEVHGKEKDFGNARFVRSVYLPESLDAQTDRLIKAHGENFPRELKKILTGDDIPAEMVRFARTPLKKAEKTETSAMDDINNLIGFDDVKSKLKDLLALKKAAEEFGREDLLEDVNLHWVLRGNPGTGKTTVAKLIGKVYKEMGLLPHGRTYKVTRSDLVAGYVGQTAIKTQKCIDQAMGGVLFIDEAYSLKRGGSSGNDFGQEAIDTLLEQMSDKNGEFAVIAAGYPKEMEIFLDSNPGFESRFEDNFLLNDYTADELLQIFELKCRSKKFHLQDETKETIRQMFENMIAARIKNWANGREAENLEKKMRGMWAKNPVNIQDESTGEMLSYYTEDHIPERYRQYLHGADSDAGGASGMPGSASGKAGSVPGEAAGRSPAASRSAFALSSDRLARPVQDYVYDSEYLRQVQGVVFIHAESPEEAGSGTGAVISEDGIILTCNHVISGSTCVRVRLKNETDGKTETEWVIADVVWSSEKLDAALLKIAGSGHPALAIRKAEDNIKVGESIYHWGYPFGGNLNDNLDELQPSLFQGYISSVQTKNGLKRINTNMEAKRGCSGGPVFSKTDGCIIGILCGSQSLGYDGLMEEINFVLPISYIWENVITSGNGDSGSGGSDNKTTGDSGSGSGDNKTTENSGSSGEIKASDNHGNDDTDNPDNNEN